MQHALVLLFIGLLLNVFHILDAELNVFPRDTEVKVNDSTYLNCSTSLEAKKVHWRHGNKYVYAGRNIIEPYNVRFLVEINSYTGTNNLVFRSVQPSDAGQYECLEDEGFGEQRSAHLIVLDDYPVCKSNKHSSGVIGPNTCGIEPDEVKLSCSITYHGDIFPVLQWQASEDSQTIIEGSVNFTTSKNDVTYTLTMKSTLDLNNSSFICQTTRSSKKNYSCSSEVIKILYVFSSKVTINMTTNDEVSCFANSSQSCSYKWKWFSGYDWIVLSNDQRLQPNKLGWHRCEATCSLGNKSCTAEPVFAEVYSAPATSGQNLLALLVLFALPVIIPIGVVIYFMKQKGDHLPLSDERQTLLIANQPQLTKYIRIDIEVIADSSKTISWTDADAIRAEKQDCNTISTLISTIMRRSNHPYSSCLEPLRRTMQMAAANLLSENTFSSKVLDPAVIIDKNMGTLLRCVNMNVNIVACLSAAGVIDQAKESLIEAEKTHKEKLRLLLDWIKKSPYTVYESFLKVMEENQQQHVANLLRGIQEYNHVPLSPVRYDRLLIIRPKLMRMIHNNVALIGELEISKAISEADAEDLKADKELNYKKNYRLINAILRGSDYSFECLCAALRRTHNTHAADYLTEGEVIAVNVNTAVGIIERDYCEIING